MNNDKMILAIGVAAVLMMCALGGVVIFNNNYHASNSDTADSSSNTMNETTVEIPVLTSAQREIVIANDFAKVVEEPAKAVIEVIVVETEEAAPVDGPTIEVVEAEPAATTQTIEEIPAIVVVGEETAPEEPPVAEVTEPAAAETAAILTVLKGGKAIASFEDFKSALTIGFLTGSGATVEERIMSCDFVNTDGTLIDCEEQYMVMVANICENDNITEEQFKAMVDKLVEKYTEPVEGSMQVAEGGDLTDQLINGMDDVDLGDLLGEIDASAGMDEDYQNSVVENAFGNQI